MHFYTLDSQAELHSAPLTQSKKSIIDIDMHWLTFGHKLFPKRMHPIGCFEEILPDIAEDHQFNFYQWYDMRSSVTHCIWYSMPKFLLSHFPKDEAKTSSLIFNLTQHFPVKFRNKAVLCFVEIRHCECVVGYMQGHCVCFKKLPYNSPLNVQHEWQYMQQAYPQWTFEHSVYLAERQQANEVLLPTKHRNIILEASEHVLKNRITLYGVH